MNIKNNDSIKYEFGIHDKNNQQKYVKPNDDLDKDNDLNENIHFESYFSDLRDELLLLVDNADQLSITEVNTGLPIDKLNIERFFNHYDEHNEELDGFIRFNELFKDEV